MQTGDSDDVQGYSLQLLKERLLPNQPPDKWWPEFPTFGRSFPSKLRDHPAQAACDEDITVKYETTCSIPD